MASITKFGQYVRLKIENTKGTVILETDNLRVDFEILDVVGWVRAKITIYNLNAATLKKIIKGDNLVTITTSLHGGAEVVIANELYVSNAINEILVPDSVTRLYCYSKVKLNLENRVSITVDNPSLRSCIKDLKKASGFKGHVIFKSFPDGYLDRLPTKKKSKQEGSFLTCLKRLGKQYNFLQYVRGDDILIMYKAHPANVKSTSLSRDEGDIILNTDNMRSNPLIGPAVIDITSNLDSRIKPGSVLDISKLITAGTNVSEDNLKVADILTEVVSGFSKYQVHQVEHRGSNYTKEWVTTAKGIAPTKGHSMPIGNETWFR